MWSSHISKCALYTILIWFSAFFCVCPDNDKKATHEKFRTRFDASNQIASLRWAFAPNILSDTQCVVIHLLSASVQHPMLNPKNVLPWIFHLFFYFWNHKFILILFKSCEKQVAENCRKLFKKSENLRVPQRNFHFIFDIDSGHNSIFVSNWNSQWESQWTISNEIDEKKRELVDHRTCEIKIGS